MNGLTPPPPAPSAGAGHPVLVSALLAILEDAAVAVLTLSEDLAQDEFLRSRLTRSEVQRHLIQMSECARQAPPALRADMPEIDWDGWITLGGRLAPTGGPALDEALWFGVQSLAPATVMWLRVYRQQQPGRFQMQC